MAQYPPEKIYAAARTLLPVLDPALRRQVEDLLAQAERGAETWDQLLALLTQDDAIQQSLRDLLKREPYDDGERMLGEYSGMGGEVVSTEAGEVYVCPVEGCTETHVIGEAGEKPPKCPIHGVTLVLKANH